VTRRPFENIIPMTPSANTLLLVRLAAELGRIFRFATVGTLAAIAYAGITFGVAETGLAAPIAASVLGFLVATAISYLGHLHYSFAVEPDHRIFLRRFTIVISITLAETMTCTWLITEGWHRSNLVSSISVSLLIPATNYICNRFWVFRSGPAAASINPLPRRSAKAGSNKT